MTLDTERAIVQTSRGVILPPPALIPIDIHELVAQQLAREAHTTNGLVLSATLKDGVNVVVAHRTPSGWEIDLFAGTKWTWDPTAGIRVAKRW